MRFPAWSGTWRALLGTLVAAAFFASVALPLLTYTLTLAAFGLLHVLSEMRYVDLRFGTRLGGRLRLTMALMLVGVVLVRLARINGLFPGGVGATLELVVVVLLTMTVLPALWRHRRWSTGIGLCVVGVLAVGVLVSPIHTLLLLAILHNATPLGFLAEVLPPGSRRRALMLAGGTFIGLPLLIASGVPLDAMQARGWIALEASILPAGPLFSHFGSYLPRWAHMESWALHAFSAFVFMQCLHYIAVILVLPRFVEDQASSGTLSWPARRDFVLAAAALSVLLFVHFWVDFAEARAWYGVAAAVHAWIELPLLLLALTTTTQDQTTPRS